MPVMFDYECGDCGSRFEHLKMSRDEPDPECPGCKAISQKLPPSVSIGTNKGRAVDIAQAEVEAQGFTNMRDNLREGDIAAPRLAAPLQKAVDNFWSGGQTILGQAKQGAALARSEGSNPLSVLQKRKRQILEASK